MKADHQARDRGVRSPLSQGEITTRSIGMISLVVEHGTALAKVSLVIKYVTEVLEGGVQKIVVFAHHRDVIAQLVDGLSSYRPVVVIGGMGAQERQDSIDAFQDEPMVRVLPWEHPGRGNGDHSCPGKLTLHFRGTLMDSRGDESMRGSASPNRHHGFGERPAPRPREDLSMQ